MQRQMLPHLVIISARKLQIGGRRNSILSSSWLKANLKSGVHKNLVEYFSTVFTLWAQPGTSAALLHCLFAEALCFAMPTLHPGCFPKNYFHQFLPITPALLLCYLFMQNHLPNSLRLHFKLIFISNSVPVLNVTPSYQQLSHPTLIYVFDSQCLLQNKIWVQRTISSRITFHGSK